jgi:uncharacterized protein YbjT (DUF2867 family)
MAATRRQGGAGAPVLVTGATGFVGRALVPALAASGRRVRATTRALRGGEDAAAEWVEADLRRAATLPRAFEGVAAAYYLVHGMAGAREDYAEEERLAAASFAREAARAGVGRIVYLGGVAPGGAPSKHLGSRLAVGEILRAGRVPALELRASMIVGAGSASWRIVRDLALRLPAMVLPAWARSRTSPVALEDVVRGLVAALDLPLAESVWLDLPGPEVLSVGEILQRVAALRGRRIPALRVPLPSPRLSSLWLRLVSDADFDVARELVLGLAHDLLPRDDRFWSLVGHGPRIGFDDAAARALAEDPPPEGLRGLAMSVEEALVDLFAPRLRGPGGVRPSAAAGRAGPPREGEGATAEGGAEGGPPLRR